MWRTHWFTDRSVHGERGIALPLTIFIVTLMTVMLAAAFARVGAEREMALGGSDAVSAQTVAQSGLQAYLGSRTSRPPDGDSLRINVSGGYADVVARVMQHPADTMANEMYVVRSTGYVITPHLGPVPQAERTVAQFAQWQSPTIDIVAAYTAANKVNENATPPTVQVSGYDACGAMPPADGLVTQKGSKVTATTGIVGSPNGYWEPGNGSQIVALADINWPGTIGGQLVPDYTSFHPWDASYPAMLVRGDLTLQNTVGYGLLIVTGDLTLQGWFVNFKGVILVGGKIDFLAYSTTLDGVAKSGLNEQLSGAAGQTPTGTLGGNLLTIRYSSCEITNALQALEGFAPIRNGWVSGWATY